MGIFGDYSVEEFISLYKNVLAFYILFGTFVLKLLMSRKDRFVRNDKWLLIIFVCLLILLVGTRKADIGTDTGNYFNFYFIPTTTQVSNYFDVFARLKSDLLFEFLVSLSFWHRNFTVFLLMVAIVTNVALYVFVRRFTNYSKKGSSLILFLSIASSFSFLSLEINIIRNGLSICFILLGLYSILERSVRNFIIYIVIAYLFHRTAIIPIVLITVVALTNKVKIKFYIGFYLLTILLSLAGFGFHIIPFLSELGVQDLKNLSYSGETTYRIGFRYDFVLYNTFFLALFLKFTNWNPWDSFLIKYYILSSTVFFLNFYIPFSDRFGVYSWIIIPILLFNTINERFPAKKIFISTIVLIGLFVINHVILYMFLS
ncbi:EpsG family protein [Tamlana sp. 2201CG12-4]|uniref:EpsG family protein n=1 Tax=Tamlana sp. 2201CG12-4 TaxID=3112582 RepID=UPI002DBBA429|nr:EpsG family protein [Tamlana sp. 2201CG12-4]MEC3908041.1 EpsG family protein [Tamlana sp. 2201CG12-4]